MSHLFGRGFLMKNPCFLKWETQTHCFGCLILHFSSPNNWFTRREIEYRKTNHLFTSNIGHNLLDWPDIYFGTIHAKYIDETKDNHQGSSRQFNILVSTPLLLSQPYWQSSWLDFLSVYNLLVSWQCYESTYVELSLNPLTPERGKS